MILTKVSKFRNTSMWWIPMDRDRCKKSYSTILIGMLPIAMGSNRKRNLIFQYDEKGRYWQVGHVALTEENPNCGRRYLVAWIRPVNALLQSKVPIQFFPSNNRLLQLLVEEIIPADLRVVRWHGEMRITSVEYDVFFLSGKLAKVEEIWWILLWSIRRARLWL